MTVSVITRKTNIIRHCVLYTQLTISPMVWLVLICPWPYFSKYLIHKFNQSLTTVGKYFMIANRNLVWIHNRPYIKTCTGYPSPNTQPGNFRWIGRYLLIVRQEKLTLGYWLKLMTIPIKNPLGIVYDELFRLSATGHATWCSHVGELLKSTGLSNTLEDQKTLVSVESINQLKSLFKTELERYYIRNLWNDKWCWKTSHP